MTTRSSGAAGRLHGRPAAASLGGPGRRSAAFRWISALIAILALGAATVLLYPSSSAAQTDGDASAVATDPAPPAEPPATTEPTTPPADPAPPQPPVHEQADPAPQPPATGPDWNESAAVDVPGSAAQPEAPAPEGEGDGAEPPAPDPEPQPTQPESTTGAYNESRVLQAIFQVQVGCRSHCHGTGQDQSASQGSNTTQEATAVAPLGSSSGAAAVNQSSTWQFVWQVQLGCVAFCWDTTMNQYAAQDSQTTQTATATGELGASALNLAETLQYIWQFQEGCSIECYGVSESQSSSQGQTTNQSATASGPDYAAWRPDGSGALPPWLVALAANLGVTIQTIFQYQEASCLENCGAETLLQEAVQQALTEQAAAAGDVPEPVAEPPATPPAGNAGQAPAGDAGPATATAARVGVGSATGDRGRGGGPPIRGNDSWRRSGRPGAGGGSTLGQLAPGGGAEQGVVSRVHTRAVSGAEVGAVAAGPASKQAGPDGTRSTRTSASAGATSPSVVSLDTSAASAPTGGSDFPWLPAGLLLVAAFAATMGLRSRPKLGV